MDPELRILTAEQLDDIIQSSDRPILAEFFAEWCSECRTLGAVLRRLASELGSKADIVRIDAAQYPELMERRQVQSVPTILLFSSGSLVRRLVGFRNAGQIRRVLDEFLVQ